MPPRSAGCRRRNHAPNVSPAGHSKRLLLLLTWLLGAGVPSGSIVALPPSSTVALRALVDTSPVTTGEEIPAQRFPPPRAGEVPSSARQRGHRNCCTDAGLRRPHGSTCCGIRLVPQPDVGGNAGGLDRRVFADPTGHAPFLQR